MNPCIANLIADIQALRVPDCTDLTVDEANALYVSLHLATAILDAAMLVSGRTDWMSDEARRLAARS